MTGNGSHSHRETLESLGYTQQLKRDMPLRDVVVHGLIYIVPMAPVGVFGFVYKMSAGMPAMAYLIAAVSMSFSALCYSEMAKRYPVAGSVYSYVRLGMNSYCGYIAGWAVLLDYLLVPAVLSIFAATALTAILPSIPGWFWVVIFVTTAVAINLSGISLTARVNNVFLAIQLCVLALFVVAALTALMHGAAALSFGPFFDEGSFSWKSAFAAVPLAALSFVGFDAIATRNEEAKGGGVAVAKATMIVFGIITVLFIPQVYLASLFVSEGTAFAGGDETANAFYNVAFNIGGDWLRITVTLCSAFVAIYANSIAAVATSSRVIFSMARDRHLPAFLAAVSEVKKVPHNSILLIGVLSLAIGVFGVNYKDILITLITFGALTAYILLNVSLFVRFVLIERSKKVILHAVAPVVSSGILTYALWNSDVHAQIVGAIWIALGAIIGLILNFIGRTDKSRFPLS